MSIESSELDELRGGSIPAETISMLEEIFEEHPDAASIVVSLLKNGWSISRTGENVICVTLRSASGEIEILGHGSSVLDAFEHIQTKTKNFSKLLEPLSVKD
jgi:hypothetical protein